MQRWAAVANDSAQSGPPKPGWQRHTGAGLVGPFGLGLSGTVQMPWPLQRPSARPRAESPFKRATRAGS